MFMGPTPIISKYMAKHFFLTFLAVFVILFSITYLFEIIELLRRTANREGASFLLVLKMGILKIPVTVNILLPFIILISALFVFLRLTKSYELIIIRSAGVSVWQFLTPIVFVAFLIGVFNITIFNPIASVAFTNYEKMEERFDLSSSESPLDLSLSGLWLKETKADTLSTIHAGSIKQEHSHLALSDISIFETTHQDEFKQRIEAVSGILQNNRFYLKQVWVMNLGKAPEFKESLELPTNLSLNKIEDNFASPETMSFWLLPKFIRFFEQTGFSSLRHKLYWYSLIFSPLSLIAMVLIAGAFSLKINNRQGGTMIKVIMALASGFALFFFTKLTNALGASANIPLFLAVAGPALIAISLCAFMLLHSEDG